MSTALPRRRTAVLAVVLVVVGVLSVIAWSPIGTTYPPRLVGELVPPIGMILGGVMAVIGIVIGLRYIRRIRKP